jgi:hypothetical protein
VCSSHRLPQIEEEIKDKNKKKKWNCHSQWSRRVWGERNETKLLTLKYTLRDGGNFDVFK